MIRRLVLLSLLAGCAGASHRAPKIDAPPSAGLALVVSRGDSIFHARACARCHGPEARGTRNGPSLLGPTYLHIKGGYSEIVRIVTNGVPTDSIKDRSHTLNMQPRGGNADPLNDDQILAVAAYVYSLGHPSK